MFFYTLGIVVYRIAVSLASPFNPKAKKMLEGRKDLWKKLEAFSANRGAEKLVWFHAASLGEFEQGRPVIEKMKAQHPGIKIVLTFFSPSGYEVRKNYELPDLVCYIPFDFPSQVNKFLGLVKPDAAIFVKYEFWLNFLNGLSKKNIPVYLISAVFHPGQPFFRWYGSRFIHALHLYRHIFTQDKQSYDLLGTLKVKNRSISGDTRFDRVVSIAQQTSEIAAAGKFCGNNLTLVAGSTYANEEEILLRAFLLLKKAGISMKIIIAPHEINESTISHLKKNLHAKEISFSVFSEGANENAEVLIIDTVGMLSVLYRYGKIAYVGGGFGTTGLHNVLEAAVYGMPVFFGPNYFRFNEAISLVDLKCAFPVKDENELFSKQKELVEDPEHLNAVAAKAKNFIRQSAGATQKVTQEIKLF
jgi:3-deoxy-D-manno-octulosonic-acid transferase